MGLYFSAPFEARAGIRIDRTLFDAIFNSPSSRAEGAYGYFYAVPFEQIISQKVLSQVVDRLHGEYDWPSDQREACRHVREHFSIRETKGPKYSYLMYYRGNDPALSIKVVNLIGTIYLQELNEIASQREIQSTAASGTMTPAVEAPRAAKPALLVLLLSALFVVLYLGCRPRQGSAHGNSATG